MKKLLFILLLLVIDCHIQAIDTTSLDIEYYKENMNSLSSPEIYSIFAQDFWKFFSGSLEKYDTPLKRDVFENSDEYKQRVEILRNLLSLIKTFTFTRQIDIRLSNYDLKQGAFYLTWGLNTGDDYYWCAPRSYNGFYFGSLPIQVVKRSDVAKMFGIGETETEYFFENVFPIYVKKEDAIKIEDNEDYKVFFEFNVIGIKKIQYLCFAFYGRSWWTVTEKVVLTDNVNVILKNINTGEIIYEKKYLIPKKNKVTEKKGSAKR